MLAVSASSWCRSSLTWIQRDEADAEHRDFIAGASAVGIGTALFYDPLICRKINDGIADYLHRHGIASVADLVGTLAA